MFAGLFAFVDLYLSIVKSNVVKEPDQMSTSESLLNVLRVPGQWYRRTIVV